MTQRQIQHSVEPIRRCPFLHGVEDGFRVGRGGGQRDRLVCVRGRYGEGVDEGRQGEEYRDYCKNGLSRGVSISDLL